MLTRLQKAIIHIYADAAGLSCPAYRDILKVHAGVSSSADPAIRQDGFDAVMAALETILWDRVHLGQIADPSQRSRYIRSEYHWRRRNPGVGLINSRQSWKIRQLWDQLCPALPPPQRTVEYFARIVHKATGKQDIGLSALTSTEADAVINALKDRLSYALRPQPVLEPL